MNENEKGRVNEAEWICARCIAFEKEPISHTKAFLLSHSY
jgi:hypothetical protein